MMTDGITVIGANSFGYNITLQDEVTVRGRIIQTNGMTYIAADTIIYNSSLNPQWLPTPVTEIAESHESELITLKDVWLVNPSDWVWFGYRF